MYKRQILDQERSRSLALNLDLGIAEALLRQFGKSNNEIILADEISPDNCRLWDKKSKLSLDKDLFRHDKGDLINAYEYIHTMLNRKLNV